MKNLIKKILREETSWLPIEKQDEMGNLVMDAITKGYKWIEHNNEILLVRSENDKSLFSLNVEWGELWYNEEIRNILINYINMHPDYVEDFIKKWVKNVFELWDDDVDWYWDGLLEGYSKEDMSRVAQVIKWGKVIK